MKSLTTESTMKTWTYTSEVMWIILAAFLLWTDLEDPYQGGQEIVEEQIKDETSAQDSYALDHLIRPPPLSQETIIYTCDRVRKEETRKIQ